MSTTFAPFIKWGDYKSKDSENPDILELQVADSKTFETAYTINVQVYLKENDSWTEAILPLKFHESNNTILLKEWNKNAQKHLIKPNKHFKLKTWLGVSTKSNRPLRRFILEF